MAESAEIGHSVWPMSERVSTDPRADVVAEAMRRFHQPLSDDGRLAARHNGTWDDSLALTHCLCWGAAWEMLDYLLDHPDVYERLSHIGRSAEGGK
jgi:hypothetical protein